jgi:NADH dehydrogenase FAD-containing subunit
VASQQGKYVANILNQHAIEDLQHHNIPSSVSSSTPTLPVSKIPVFQYQHLGAMAQVGQWKGVFDSSSIDRTPDGKAVSTIPPVKGMLAFFLWRAAYWTKQVSIVNKILIPMFWFKCMIFGRDISRF